MVRASQGCCLLAADTELNQQQNYRPVGKMASPNSALKQNGTPGNSPITRITIARGHKGEWDFFVFLFFVCLFLRERERERERERNEFLDFFSITLVNELIKCNG